MFKSISNINIYISRKTLRSLRPEIGEFAGQERTGHREGNTVQDRSWQRDRSKAAEQK